MEGSLKEHRGRVSDIKINKKDFIKNVQCISKNIKKYS
jgi:hypothetical protein